MMHHLVSTICWYDMSGAKRYYAFWSRWYKAVALVRPQQIQNDSSKKNWQLIDFNVFVNHLIWNADKMSANFEAFFTIWKINTFCKIDVCVQISIYLIETWLELPIPFKFSVYNFWNQLNIDEYLCLLSCSDFKILKTSSMNIFYCAILWLIKCLIASTRQLF